MRIWDVPPARLCDKHLLGEHRELHAVWSIIVNGRSGYANHPETNRWRGKLAALFVRHDDLVAEMARRGFRHQSPLDATDATGAKEQDELLQSVEEQLAILAAKDCACPRSGDA